MILRSQTASYSYDAWGGVASLTGASANQLGYTAQRLDPETGLMPLGAGARYYASNLGRFTQQDTWTGLADSGQTRNRYAYGNSNPLRYTDPSGHRGTQFDPPDYSINGNDIINLLSSAGTAAYELIALPADLVTAIGARVMGIDAEYIQFSSRTAQFEQKEFLSGKSGLEISAEVVKGLAFGALTFGIGPEIFGQLELVRQLANGEITTEEYDARFTERAGAFAFNVAFMAVAAAAGRGRPSVIGEGAAEAAARRTPLRETLGKIGERIGEFKGRVGERLSHIGERFDRALDNYAARAEENVRRAVEKGRKNELGVLGEIPDTVDTIRQGVKDTVSEHVELRESQDTIHETLKERFPGLRDQKPKDKFTFRIFSRKELELESGPKRPYTIIDEK